MMIDRIRLQPVRIRSFQFHSSNHLFSGSVPVESFGRYRIKHLRITQKFCLAQLKIDRSKRPFCVSVNSILYTSKDIENIPDETRIRRGIKSL